MATFNRFEDIEIWKKARVLCKEIHICTLKFPFNNDYKLRDQIKGSSGSIMDNVAEGFGREGNKEFVNFLSYAQGSANECKSQLYRALDFEYIDEEKFNDLGNQIGIIIANIKNFSEYLKNSEFKGNKFKK